MNNMLIKLDSFQSLFKALINYLKNNYTGSSKQRQDFPPDSHVSLKRWHNTRDSMAKANDNSNKKHSNVDDRFVSIHLHANANANLFIIRHYMTDYEHETMLHSGPQRFPMCGR